MVKSLLTALSLSVLTFIIVGCASDSVVSQPEQTVVAPTLKNGSQPKVGIRHGELAPDFMVRNLAGEEVLFSTLAGNVIFLNFWATWCTYCREEMASMERMYQEYKDQGFLVVALDVGGRGETVEKIKKFIEEGELTFPILVDLRGKTKGAFKVDSLPSTYILDSRGVIQKIIIGGRDWDKEINREIVLDVLEQDGE